MIAEGATEEEFKAALRELVDGGKLVYSYFGGSFIEIPHKKVPLTPDEVWTAARSFRRARWFRKNYPCSRGGCCMEKGRQTGSGL